MAKRNSEKPLEETISSSDSTVVNQPVEEISKIEIEEVKEKKLSKQAENWKVYLESIGKTPSDFIKRFPNTKYKIFIEELI